jgi:preprotein translocase subunit SecA
MSLYSQWMEIAQSPRSNAEQQEFWQAYFAVEQSVYEKILSRYPENYTGKLSELAKEFEMEPVVFSGFIDGINTSLKAGEYDVETLEEDSDVCLEVDLEKLYYNMMDAKAQWLYTLPQWETLLSEEKRKELTKQYRSANVYVAQPTVGRNDPCPCGSGKKYKKCCGKDA